MVVGARQSFQFFRQKTWFLENNRGSFIKLVQSQTSLACLSIKLIAFWLKLSTNAVAKALRLKKKTNISNKMI